MRALQVRGCEELGVADQAHSSTIRDIAALGSRAVVSVGADQRVNAWALPSLQPLASCITEVCDTSCIDVAPVAAPASAAETEVVVVVGGMGVQTFRLSL